MGFTLPASVRRTMLSSASCMEMTSSVAPSLVNDSEVSSITRRAPRERTSSRLRVLHTPVTSAPKCRASCTAQTLKQGLGIGVIMEEVGDVETRPLEPADGR
jgi:hypothetical protein